MTPAELWRWLAETIQLDLDGTAQPWHESGYLFGRWPDPESDPRLHLSYAIGLPEDAALEARQRSHIDTVSTVVIHYAVGLTMDDELGSYEAALEREMEMVRALAAAKVHIQRKRRRLLDNEGVWFIGEIQATIDHQIPL